MPAPLEAAPEPASADASLQQAEGGGRCRVCLQRARRFGPPAVLFAAAIVIVVFEPLQSVIGVVIAGLGLATLLYGVYLLVIDPRRLARETAHVSTRVVTHVQSFGDTIAAEHRRAQEAAKPKPLTDVQALLQGATFTKYGRSGGPRSRWVWLRLRGAALEICWADNSRAQAKANRPTFSSFCKLADMLDVVEGRQTEVFAKHRLPLQGEDCCFSLVAESRTLDLEAPNAATAKLWVATLRDLVRKHTTVRVGGGGGGGESSSSGGAHGVHAQAGLLPVSTALSSSNL